MNAALYARVSTEEQKEGKTIQSQLEELRRFVNEKEWNVSAEYLDEGWSGSVLARPQLDRLRDDAEKGLFEAVIVNDVDRIGRDVSLIGIVKKDLERKNVQLIFRKISNSGSPADELMINMLGSFAQFERAMMADRTRRGRRYKAEVRKVIVGNIPPYGYDYIPIDKSSNQNGRYVINKHEASIVKMMFDWVDKDGLSALEVVKRLSARGIKPKNAKEDKDKLWAKSSVLRILHNETYSGVTYYNKHESVDSNNNEAKYQRQSKSGRRLRSRSEWIPITLPEDIRIVTPDQFLRVQEQLRNNTAFSKRNSKHEYLLRGLVKCGKCGTNYLGDPAHGDFSYRDGNRGKRFPRPRDCDGRSVNANLLETTVWNEVSALLKNPTLILEQVEKRRKLHEMRYQSLPTKEEELRKRQDKAKQEEGRLLEAYRNEAITLNQLKSEMTKVRKQADSITLELDSIKNSLFIQPKQEVRKTIRDYCKQVSRRLDGMGFEEKQKILRLLLTAIVVEGETFRIKGIIKPGPIVPPSIFAGTTLAGYDDQQRRLSRLVWPGLGQ